MNVPLSAVEQRLVRRKIEAGEFASPREVVSAGLKLLTAADRRKSAELADIRAGVRRGLSDVSGGRMRPLDATTFDRVRSVGQTRRRTIRRRKSA